MSLEQDPIGLGHRLGRDVWTLPAMLDARAERSADSPALWSHSGPDGAWCSTSWRSYRDTAASIAAGLRQLGLLTGESVGIMAPSCERWDLLQMGILAAGGVVVGLDPHDLHENLDTAARHCRLKGLIVLDPQWVERLSSEARGGLRFVVQLERGAGIERAIAYDELLRMGGPTRKEEWSAAAPDGPATIIFTSGTTGAPKGVRYTHRQICLAVASILEAFPDIGEASRLACWLPLSNMFQRIINALAIACGASTYYVEDPRAIMSQVGGIDPHLFIGVPRFYEKLYSGIMDKVGKGSSCQRALVAWALRVGGNHASALRRGQRPSALRHVYHGLADRLVLRRLRGVMGSDLRYMVSGSAPMPRWLLERFHAMGLLVLEAYGMSENVIPVAANRLRAYRFGTVGRPLRGCEVRLAEDGELMVRGPGVTGAYYGEERTELRDPEGYLASGDFAAIDHDGFITLTGRKSEIIKTATGRRIAPAGIETLLLQATTLEHAMVVGANRPFLVAVVDVSPGGLATRVGNDARQPDLRAYCDRLRLELAPLLTPLPAYKRPSGLLVTTRPFTVEGGELTANLKLRRQNIAALYAAELDTLYRRLAEARGGGVLQAVAGKEHDTMLCSL